MNSLRNHILKEGINESKVGDISSLVGKLLGAHLFKEVVSIGIGTGQKMLKQNELKMGNIRKNMIGILSNHPESCTEETEDEIESEFDGGELSPKKGSPEKKKSFLKRILDCDMWDEDEVDEFFNLYNDALNQWDDVIG